MNKKKCFVISPIGDAGSPVRERSDDLFDLLVGPALERFDFEVIRADKIPGSGQITNEIVNLIQTAELCVVDLTDANPNVFYECGRRHETGKPYIHLCAQGTKLPFDLAGFRTLYYDLSTPRAVFEGVSQLRAYVQEDYSAGFTGDRAVSLATIGTKLDRLERRLAAIGATGSTNTEANRVRLRGSIRRNLVNCVRLVETQDFEAAEDLLKAMFERFMNDENSQVLLALAGSVAYQGESMIAASLILQELTSTPVQDCAQRFEANAVGSAIAAVIENDEEELIDADCETRLLEIARAEHNPTDSRGFLYNQLQRLFNGSERQEDAIAAGRSAVELAPEITAYRTNLAMNYRQLGNLTEAIRWVRDGDDPFDLADPFSAREAAAVYAAAGDAANMKLALRAASAGDVTSFKILVYGEKRMYELLGLEVDDLDGLYAAIA